MMLPHLIITMAHRKKDYIGELPRGCTLCERGAKLVLFVTGLCPKGCVYCPLSEKRKGKDLTWANERPVDREEDILVEAERMRAQGAGITGGEPMLRAKRTLGFIELLRDHFGSDFHLHLYTAKALSAEEIKSLKKAGLDELRFHLLEDALWGSLEKAVEVDLDVGAEIPALPGKGKEIITMVKRLKSLEAGFLNLNELEFADSNMRLAREGMRAKSDDSYGVEGSEGTAREVLDAGLDFSVHYCSSSFKDGVQLTNRLKRTAKNIARQFEEVTDEGLLFKGTVEIAKPSEEALARLQKKLIKDFGLPSKMLELDLVKHRLETSPEIAAFLAEKNTKSRVMYSLVEEYPTWDRLEVSKTSFNRGR